MNFLRTSGSRLLGFSVNCRNSLNSTVNKIKSPCQNRLKAEQKTRNSLHEKCFSTLAVSNVKYSNTPLLKRLAIHRQTFTSVNKSTPQNILKHPNVRRFHFTPRRNVPPIVWIFIRPVANIIAIFAGRGVRKWWQKLAPGQQQQFWQKLKSNWLLIAVGAGMVPFGGVTYYVSHLEAAPITGRKRFIAFTHDQFLSICKYEAETLFKTFDENTVLDKNSLAVQRVTQVKDRLCEANKDINQMTGQNWTVTVVKMPEQNAFVLPTGDIFVFTGLLDFVKNDDQLAVVLGHEMAHALLSHGAEKMSFTQLVDLFVIAVMAAIWLFIPFDGIALITQWFYKKVTRLMIHMPYDREMEKEADKVGIDLVAKACYDVREAVRFWTRMDIVQEQDGENVAEFLSTHPSSRNRAEYFNHIMPRLFEMRDSCKCPKLPDVDPRILSKDDRSVAENKKSASIARQNLSRVTVKIPVGVKTES